MSLKPLNCGTEVTLRPLRANAGIEAAYRKALQDLIRDMATSMLLHVRAAYRRHDPRIGFASDAADGSVLLRRALKKWGSEWRAKLDAASNAIARAFAHKAKRNLDQMFKKRLSDAGFTVNFQVTPGMTSAYRAVIAENVSLIRSIAPQFLKAVETSVWDSVMRGSKLSALTASIEHNYHLAHQRAAFIARDQNNKARAVMEEARRKELGIRAAIWQHSHAGKQPRPTHVAMNGKRYEIEKGMWDSAIDKFTWPGMEPNCRCTSRAVIE